MYLLVTRMYLFVTRMHSYVTRIYWYVTRMHSYVTRMLPVCTHLLLVCTRMLPVFTRMYSYVTLMHSHVTRMYSYVLVWCFCYDHWILLEIYKRRRLSVGVFSEWPLYQASLHASEQILFLHIFVFGPRIEQYLTHVNLQNLQLITLQNY